MKTNALGKQQCMDGIDEDDCENLELNECELNEYRCEDGSCIPEEYWLDGQYDCSDKSDEQTPKTNKITSVFCPLVSSQFDCDEATAHLEYFACGDGQFVEDSLFDLSCYNYRSNMFFCEASAPPIEETWTLENGHCVGKDRISKNLTEMDPVEKCIFYLKCKLTRSIIIGCDAVINQFHSECRKKTIYYPSGPLLKPYVHTVYRQIQGKLYPIPNYVWFNGSIKCVGHQAHSGVQQTLFEWELFFSTYPFDTLFCHNAEIKMISNLQFDRNCWNNTKQSHFCQQSLRCISKHRLQNGIRDCISYEDEREQQAYCILSKHRLKCSAHSPLDQHLVSKSLIS